MVGKLTDNEYAAWVEAHFVQMSRRGFKGDDPGAFLRSIPKEDVKKQAEEFSAIYKDLLAAKGGK